MTDTFCTAPYDGSGSTSSVPLFGRAYSVLDIKRLDADERVIEGIATTPVADRMDDVVESMGAEFTLPMPLLWQHRSGEPVGHVEFAQKTEKGIPFRARIARIEEPGELKNLVDKAWHAVKSRLVRGVSIGFRTLESEPMFKGKNEFVGIRFKRWEWLELSLVTIPANADASIATIRNIDVAQRDGDGNGRRSGRNQTQPVVKQEAKTMSAKQTIAEQISAFEATRAAKAARMTEIMEKAAEDHVTLDDAQQTEYDQLETEVKAVGDHLVRLGKLEDANRNAAKPVVGNNQHNGSDSRAGVELATTRANPIISARRQVPQWVPFVRIMIAKAAGHMYQQNPADIARERWHESTPEVETILRHPQVLAGYVERSAVPMGTTTDSAWAGPLVQYQQATGEFIELLRALTFLGRIPGFRRVPFNITMPAATSGTSAQWVGEAQSKPVSAMAFATVTMRWAKVANIVVLTDELVRFSNPAAEEIVRRDMTESMAEFLDQQFITPSVTAVSNVSPASITNGAPTSVASGTTANALRADLKTVMASFASADIPFMGIVLLMPSNVAASIAMMTNSLGQTEFPTMSPDGGTLLGFSVIVSDNVPAGHIVFLKPSEILLADDGNVAISVSREASLQLDTAPSEPPTTMVSLWQQNAVGIRAERYINWLRRRTNAVYYITGADYGSVASV